MTTRRTFARLVLATALVGCGTATDPTPRPDPAPPTPTDAPDPTPRAVAETPPPPTAAAPDRDEALVEDLRGLAFDPPPPATTNDKHYIVSNERRLDLYRPDIDGLGGVHLGVGTDQNFLLAAWSRPSVMVIVDFDQQVVDLYAIHGAFFAAAPDIAAFERLWSPEGAETARALLRAAPKSPDRTRRLRQFDESRAEVHDRFVELRKRYEELDIRSYLDTPSEYDFVRDLFVRDRVVVLRGDFTRPGVVAAVGEVLREHEAVVRTLYLSNIEQYFAYRAPFKANMLGLPFDAQTLVLRTLPGRPAGFQYILQRGDDFHAWMRAKKVWSVYTLRDRPRGEPLAASERWFIDKLPTEG